LPSVVKASSIATHNFNFDAREEAMGAITKAANYHAHNHALALYCRSTVKTHTCSETTKLFLKISSPEPGWLE
jgi:hypothetical protein